MTERRKMLRADPMPLANDRNGVIRVGGTRVSLDSILIEYLNGASPEQILDCFPAVSLADIHASIAYYLRHREMVEAYLDGRRVEEDAIESETRRRFPTAELRKRLLRRAAGRTDRLQE